MDRFDGRGPGSRRGGEPLADPLSRSSGRPSRFEGSVLGRLSRRILAIRGDLSGDGADAAAARAGKLARTSVTCSVVLTIAGAILLDFTGFQALQVFICSLLAVSVTGLALGQLAKVAPVLDEWNTGFLIITVVGLASAGYVMFQDGAMARLYSGTSVSRPR